MKKYILLFTLLFISITSLFAHTEGSFRINAGGGSEVYLKENLNVWYVNINLSKDKYFDGPYGYYYGTDINVPINYQIQDKATIPFNTFRNFIDFDLFGGFSYKKESFHFSIGPSLSFFFYQTFSGSLITQMNHGIFCDLKYDIKCNDILSISFCTTAVFEYWNIDFMSFSRSGFSTILEINPYLGISISYTTKERLGS